MTLVAVIVPLLLCFVAFLVADSVSMRQSRERETAALAAVLAENLTASLDFDDRLTASETLQSLSCQPNIQSATLYDRAGEVFAAYPPGHQTSEDPKATTGAVVVEQEIHGQLSMLMSDDGADPLMSLFDDESDGIVEEDFSDVAQNNAEQSAGSDLPVIGKLQLRADTTDIQTSLLFRGLLTSIVLLLSLAAGLTLSMTLQRSLLRPIFSLVESARDVAANKQYTATVPVLSNDELGELATAYNQMLTAIQESEQKLTTLNDELENRVKDRTAELEASNDTLVEEMGKRESLQKELVAASRQAGMAEVATGVLHNVGNVLNSVNVSSSMLVERIRKSSLTTLSRVSDVIQENADDLGTFVTSDPRGQQFPSLLNQLTVTMGNEQKEQLDELQTIIDNVEHIKEIVSTQQSFARVQGVTESVNLADLVNDAIRINDSGLRKRGVDIVVQCEMLDEVVTEKHKVLQILINLIGNAKHALEKLPADQGKLTIRIWHELDQVAIEVRDNGVGISAENLDRIFSHGFTTKKEGHGFGLHSSALAAKELGGSLNVGSDGVGKGAAFTLSLPFTESTASPEPSDQPVTQPV